MMNVPNTPIWIPSEERINNSNFKKYFSFLKTHFNKEFSDYNELYIWSITEIEEFWRSIWEYSRIINSKSYHSILSKRIMPGTDWFEGSRLNFAENLLRYRDDRIALISIREKHPTIKITYKELYNLVARCR